MAMDGLALNAIATELGALIGGKIDRIQTPDQDRIVLLIRTNAGTKRLLFSAHAENGRLQTTLHTFENPQQAPAFCMLLRRWLVGGRIQSIEQRGLDRVCTLEISARNELFDEVTLKLVFELTGKHANAVLVDPNGAILDALRRVPPSDAYARVILPSFRYEPIAPSGKRNPFEADSALLHEIYAANGDVPRALVRLLEGVSKSTAEALFTAAPNADALMQLFSRMKAAQYEPCVLFDADGAPQAVLPFHAPMHHAQKPFDTLSAALDCYYERRDAHVLLHRKSAELRKTLATHISRARNKYAAFRQTLQDGDSFEQYRVYGELILANLHLGAPNREEALVTDYYCDPPQKRTIPLVSSLSMQENAKRYFKLYRKGKLAKAYASANIDALADEIAYLEGQAENIEKCETVYELAEIREELIREQYLRAPQKPVSKPSKQSSAPMLFRSSDGIAIYVGKNNRQNDRLTLQTARANQMWLHVKNMPGSHVLIDLDGEPPAQTLLEAAMLAAYYSQARFSEGVPVDYTLRRNVKKPAGARPGMVLYSTNRTLYVTPNAPRVLAMREQ